MSEEFKARPSHLLAILAIVVLACLLDEMALLARMPSAIFKPFGASPVGLVAGAIFLVFLLCGMSFLIYFLVKRGFSGLVRGLIAFVILFVGYSVFSFYSLSALALLGPTNDICSYGLAYALPMALTSLAFYFSVLGKGKLKHFFSGLLGAFIGAFLAFLLPSLMVFALVVLLIFYDIYAVYRGPVGKLVAEEGPLLDELYFEVEGLEIGLGDSVFYAMLPAHFLAYGGPIPCISSIVGILIGSFASLKILEKREMIPGLPIALGLGLLAGLIAFLA